MRSCTANNFHINGETMAKRASTTTTLIQCEDKNVSIKKYAHA